MQNAELLNSFGKRADIIWNETEDVLERMGIAHEDPTLDQKQAVIIPLTIRALQRTMPGTINTLSSVGSSVAPYAKAAAEEIPKTLGNVLGVDTGQFIDYDPEGEADTRSSGGYA